jgi:hypothetical protein
VRRAAVLVGLVALALFGAGEARAAIEVSIASPADGAHSLQGAVPVEVNASATNGIFSVQLYVDGKPSGVPSTMTVGPYRYLLSWDTSTVSQGDHTLAALATDWSGSFVTQMSSSINVDVGPAYPTIAINAPAPWAYVRGTTSIDVATTSAVGSGTVALTLDGQTISSPWNTATTADGAHTLRATITDGRGKTASASEQITVDNAAPTTYITSPSANAGYTGTLPAQAHASDAFGVQSVQFAIDGTAVGQPSTAPDAAGGYLWSQSLDISQLPAGSHTLTSIATDNAGNRTTSAPVSFTVGTPPPKVVLTQPADWSYASKTVTIAATVTGGAAPVGAQLMVDGLAVGTAINAAPYSFQWDTTKAAEGSHTLAVAVKDALGRTASSQVLHETVDNTRPTAVIYQPPANARVTGTITLQVHASDTNGVKSVQLTIDGKPVGAVLTAPDAGQVYLYSTTFDTSLVAPGAHTVSATVTDYAGNVATAAPVSITTGTIAYLPVLNYHEIAPIDGYSIYDQTPAEADSQLAYLKQNGYQSVTLEQYQAWLAGQNIGIAKPVLITVDDGLGTELAWDALLQKYGFKAVMFVITGHADQKTPGSDDDPNNLTWSQIQSLAANGRWQIAFHAGQYGHGDSYDSGASAGGITYTASCPYFYTCLGQTTTGIGRTRRTTPESFSTYKTMVTQEVNAGIAELKQWVPSASFVAWAAPFNDAGQWTNLYNDSSGQAQAWFPGFMASKFPIVFTQTNPVQYAQASGTVGSLTAFNRHYRFEVHTDTTLQQFAAALADPAFAR